MSYVVKLPDGQYAGRANLADPLGPQPFAFAYCYDSDVKAATVADAFPGSVVRDLDEERALHPSAQELHEKMRRQRLENAAEIARQRADAAFKGADVIAQGIPMGQPILVGHHSERRHRRDLDRIDRGMRRSVEESKRAKDLARRAASVGTAGVSSDDDLAVVKLRGQLADLEVKQERDKAINKAVRSKDPGAALLALDLPPKAIEELLTPDFAGRLGVPDYVLTNRNGNMARIRKRIEELVARHGQETKETEPFPGLRVVDNVEDNRLQIFFDAKPPESVRDTLKRYGFRWAPSEGAWQRQRHSGGQAHLVLAVVESMHPKAYLSRTDKELWTVIVDGSPICPEGPLPQAMEAAKRLNVTLPSVRWDGELGKFVAGT